MKFWKRSTGRSTSGKLQSWSKFCVIQLRFDRSKLLVLPCEIAISSNVHQPMCIQNSSCRPKGRCDSDFVAKFRRLQNKSKWCVIPVWGFWLKSRGCSPKFNRGAPANIAFCGFCLFSSSGSLLEINITNSNEGNFHVISSSNDRIWDPKYMTRSYQRNSIQMEEPWHP